MTLKLFMVLVLAAIASTEHTAVVDPDGDVVLHWTPERNANLVTMRVEARTLGWAAVGFSPSGGMTGADIVMGWISDGKLFVQDMYAEKNGQPLLDSHSDVEALSGWENDTHTVFSFKRPLKSCDTDQDVDIGMDTTRLIWALHHSDPPQPDSPAYHGPSRGVRSISLDGAGTFQYPAPGASELFMIEHNGTDIPPAETYYHCSMHRIPDFDGKKMHYTGYRVRPASATRAYLHHFVMYACTLPEWMHESFEEFSLEHPGAECYGPNMPPQWTLCKNVLIAWAVGGEGEMLPDDVGIPLGHRHGGSTYFMLETHYDNPHKHTGLQDFSGIELYFARDLRPVEGEVLTVGQRVSSSQLIPPGQENFVTSSVCTSQCTDKYLPNEGVRVHAVLLHAHLAGRTMLLRHIRDGKELEPIAHDMSYDFNFQQSRVIDGDARILPGDSLVLECGYDTEDRQDVTMGGFGSRNEMCLAFVTYYPRTPLMRCMSQTPLGPALRDIGLNSVDINGLYLPVETAGELWAHGGYKFASERNKLVASSKNATAGPSPASLLGNITGEDWFNKVELLTVKILQEGKPPTPLYTYLKQAEWNPTAVEKLQRDIFEGPMYGICMDRDISADKHYTHSFSGPWSVPKYDPMVEKARPYCRGTEGPSGAAVARPLVSLGVATAIAAATLIAVLL